MARVWPCSNEADARESVRVTTKLAGLPKMGTRIGGGRHGPIEEATTQRLTLPRVKAGQFALVVPDVLLTLSADAEARARLTAGERTYLDSKLALVTDDPVWESTEATGVTTVDPLGATWKR